MDKDDWQKVERALSRLYGTIILQCDQYRLFLANQPVGPFACAIHFYVDGYFRGKWMLEDCEERRRFSRPVERYVYSAALRAKVKKFPSAYWPPPGSASTRI